jgi:ABC-type methionine transport system ATPase subunit
MVKRRLMLTFTPELIKEPIIHNLGQQFNIVTNINLADIAEDRGWVILELEGDEKDIEEGITWITSRGMRVDPAGNDVEET